MKIVVTGGRYFGEQVGSKPTKKVWEEREFGIKILDQMHKFQPITHLAQGGAPGADRIALVWARINKIPVKTYPADWERYGKRAGPIRNKEMLVKFEPELVLALPGGRGTDNCVREAQKMGIEVYDRRNG